MGNATCISNSNYRHVRILSEFCKISLIWEPATAKQMKIDPTVSNRIVDH